MCAAPLLCAFLLLAAPGASAAAPSKCDDGDSSCAAMHDSTGLLQSQVHLEVAGEEVSMKYKDRAFTDGGGQAVKCSKFKSKEECDAQKGTCDETGTGCEFDADGGDQICKWLQEYADSKASLNLKGCLGQFDKIEIGGATSGWIDKKVLARPQFRYAERFNVETQKVEPCAGQENCWNGYNPQSQSGPQRLLGGTLTDATYSKVMVEVVLNCEIERTASMQLRTAWLENAVIKATYNGDNIFDKADSSVSGFFTGHMKNVNFDVNKSDPEPVLMIEASREDADLDATFAVAARLLKVPVSFEDCMESKKCLKVPGMEGSILRSSANQRLQCLTSSELGDSGKRGFNMDLQSSESDREAVGGACPLWYACIWAQGTSLWSKAVMTQIAELSDADFNEYESAELLQKEDHKMHQQIMKKINKNKLLQAEATTTSAANCYQCKACGASELTCGVDPDAYDLLSEECGPCRKKIENFLADDPDPTELREGKVAHFCKVANVRCDWKATHCGAADNATDSTQSDTQCLYKECTEEWVVDPGLLQEGDASNATKASLLQRSAQMDISASLDDSLSGKRVGCQSGCPSGG